MTAKLTITMAQLTQSVGDLRGNADAMIAAHGARPDSDLIVFPELQLIGYPPEDLVLKPAVWERAASELDRLAAATAGPGAAMLVGSIFREDDKLYNGIALLEGGHIRDIRYKVELPNYGTFDEKRLFASGPLPEPIEFRGCKIGLPICEDVWFPAVCEHLKSLGTDLFISVHGSPYEIEKDDMRLGQVATKRVRETGIPMLFLNRVGGQDEIVFDGASFVLNGDASVMHQLPDWDEAIVDTRWSCEGDEWRCAPGEIHQLDDHPADIYNAMIVGLRDYVNRNRFPGVLLGLSGGIDSALSAAVAVDALGADRVWNIMMPSRFTSQESLDDAAGCAEMLGTRLDTIPINPAVEGFDAMLEDSFADSNVDITEENIQSRIRGVTLMALSNKFGHMLLTTGNKSEVSVGYSTLYGDMCGGLAVISDLPKMKVYALARHINTAAGRELIPVNTIEKPPSAELRPDQKDEDSLPPYPVLDGILRLYVEAGLSRAEIVEKGYDQAVVDDVVRKVDLNEYKRKQAAPGLKTTPLAFGIGRRIPIVQKYVS